MTTLDFLPQMLPPEGEMGFVDIGTLSLDNGQSLPECRIAFQRWGELSAAKDNVVMVLHALTGDSHVHGPANEHHPTPGWWDKLVGPRAALDTNQWCVIATNALGGCRGSTGPSSLAPDGRAWGSRFPSITIRDQVNADITALHQLGITSVAAVLGGSMGGARALEWMVTHPDHVRAGLLLAIGPRATAAQIGIQTIQISAIKSDPQWYGGDYYAHGVSPDTGLSLARQIAHLSYRNPTELDHRFANNPQSRRSSSQETHYAIESYLHHQGKKLVSRFDAGSYVHLTDALNSHDVGRDRGGVIAALHSCSVPVVIGGINTDYLYPLYLQQQLADLLPNSQPLQVINSRFGHDGFLLETHAIGRLIRQTLTLAQ